MIAVIDFETTGLKAGIDEVLQDLSLMKITIRFSTHIVNRLGTKHGIRHRR